MELLPDVAPSRDELVDLYSAVGWSAYTDDPDALDRAVRNSTFVITAREGDELVGLARVLRDDVSTLYLQDVLVRPSHQGQGTGRRLVEACLERYSHVRQRMLLTDDEPHQHRLYRRVGFHDVSKLKGVNLHAFVDIDGAGLESDDGA